MPAVLPTPCLGRGELFFSDDANDERFALALCQLCPTKTRDKCRSDAHERRELYGVWGGETQDERLRKLNIQHRRMRSKTVNRVTEEMKEEIIRLNKLGVGRREIRERLGISRFQVAGVLRRQKGRGCD